MRRRFLLFLVAGAVLAIVACGGKTTRDGTSSDPASKPGAEAAATPACTPATRAGDPCSSTYATCSAGVHQLRCINGAWQDDESTWYEPPIDLKECPLPPSDPLDTKVKSCSPVGAECFDEDRCPARPRTEARKRFVCNDKGKWMPQGSAYTAPCPSVRPAEGASCADCAGAYPVCTYEGVNGCAAVDAFCDPQDGKWKMLGPPCNGATAPVDAGADAP